jgi:hypothetical protein
MGFRHNVPAGVRRWGFGGLAMAWYAVTTFLPVGLPNVAVVLVLGLLVMLSVEPDSRFPTGGVVASPQNLVLAGATLLAFVPVAVGMNLLLGRIPIESGHAILATSAAVCVALPRLAETGERHHRALLGHRELIIAVTALVAGVRADRAGELLLAVTGFAVLAPVVMAVRRIRLGGCSPRGLTRRGGTVQAASTWLFLTLLAVAGLVGALFVWRVTDPDAQPVIVGAFWVGLAATAVLTAFPLRSRRSVATTALALLGSIVLAVQLVGIVARPSEAVTIGLPSTQPWQVVNGGRSGLVDNHEPLSVQRDAIDLVQLVDGRTFRGDGSRLEDFAIFGQPLLAVAGGRVTAAVDGHPDLPVGGSTWHDMAGNHVVLDIGGGHYVLYAHLRQASLRVQIGDQVRRGQVIGQVGDSGNSGQPHLHLQVQDKPTFDVEDRDIHTFPIRFDRATVPDPHRGDTVQPAAP